MSFFWIAVIKCPNKREIVYSCIYFSSQTSDTENVKWKINRLSITRDNKIGFQKFIYFNFIIRFIYWLWIKYRKNWPVKICYITFEIDESIKYIERNGRSSIN